MQARLRSDTGLVLVTMLLLGISVLMVFSTTGVVSQSGGTAFSFVTKHVSAVALGIVLMLCLSRVHPAVLYKISIPLLALSFVSLVLVLIPGLGVVVGGARRWFAVGPVRIQPGEIAKLCAAIYTAAYIGRHHPKMLRFVPGALVPLFGAGLFSVLLLLEPDFGSTVILLAVVFVQLLMVSRLSHLGGLGLGALSALFFLVWVTPYRFRRFESFLNPFQDAGAAGYQLVQSLIAVGSGGLTGQGLGGGKQKLFYLPAAHTDFIFAVIAEEWGLIGAAAIILLFVAFALFGIRIARRLANDAYLMSLAVGLTALIVIPAFLNMAVVLGLLPTKGLVLPLVAYGGTAMIVNLSAVGILLALSRVEA